MVKRRYSKSARIRAYKAANPSASVREIAEAVRLPSNYVYGVLWADARKGHTAASKATPKVTPKATPKATQQQQQSANDTQVGGAHYKSKAIQPWDYIVSNRLGYLEGNIVKYVSRWQDKNGMQDLEKARHYLDKLIETAQKNS